MEDKKVHAKHVKNHHKKSDKYIFIDVRSPGEYATHHIKGSFNIPLDELHENKENFKKIKKDILLICRSGMRATKAGSLLKQTGVENLYILDGGMEAWKKEGFPVAKHSNVWDLERQVRFIAGTLVFIGMGLGYFVSSYFYLLPTFVGLGLAFAAISNSCMMGYLLMKLPYNKIKTRISTKDVVNEILKN